VYLTKGSSTGDACKYGAKIMACLRTPKAPVLGTNRRLSDGVIMLRETYLRDQASAPELPGWP